MPMLARSRSACDHRDARPAQRIEHLDTAMERQFYDQLAHRSQWIADTIAYPFELVARWATRRFWELERRRP